MRLHLLDCRAISIINQEAVLICNEKKLDIESRKIWFLEGGRVQGILHLPVMLVC